MVLVAVVPLVLVAVVPLGRGCSSRIHGAQSRAKLVVSECGLGAFMRAGRGALDAPVQSARRKQMHIPASRRASRSCARMSLRMGLRMKPEQAQLSRAEQAGLSRLIPALAMRLEMSPARADSRGTRLQECTRSGGLGCPEGALPRVP